MEEASPTWIREQIIIDGAAGHLIPPTETEKLHKVQTKDKKPIAEFSQDYSRFSVNLPDRTAHYAVVHERVNRKSGFKAVAYREISPQTGEPKLDEQGRCELRISFQGLVAGRGDMRTGYRAIRGKKAAHVQEVEDFTRYAIGEVGGAQKVSALISGSHSYGVINALESYRVAHDMGVKDINVLLMEAVGAAAALDDIVQRREAQGDPTKADTFKQDIEQCAITVNVAPASHFVRMARGDAVGTAYQLHIPSLGDGAMQRIKGGVDRHRLGTLMQGAFNGAELRKVDIAAMQAPQSGRQL